MSPPNTLKIAHRWSVRTLLSALRRPDSSGHVAAYVVFCQEGGRGYNLCPYRLKQEGSYQKLGVIFWITAILHLLPNLSGNLMTSTVPETPTIIHQGLVVSNDGFQPPIGYKFWDNITEGPINCSVHMTHNPSSQPR